MDSRADVEERGQPVIEGGKRRLIEPPWPQDMEERRLADLKQWALDNPDNPMVALVMQQVNGIEPTEEEFGAYWQLYGRQWQQSKRHIRGNAGGHGHANKCHWDAESSRQLLAVMNHFQESLNEMDRRGIRVTIPSRWAAISQKLPNRFSLEPAKFATSCKVHYANLCRVYRGQQRSFRDMELSNDLCRSIGEYHHRCQYVRQTGKRQGVRIGSFGDDQAKQLLNFLVNSVQENVVEPVKQRHNSKSEENIITMTSTAESVSKTSSKVIQKSSSQASKEITADAGRLSSSSCSRKVQRSVQRNFKGNPEEAFPAAANDILPRRLVHRNTTDDKPEDHHRDEGACARPGGTSTRNFEMNKMSKRKGRGDDHHHLIHHPLSRDHDFMDEDDDSRDHLVLDENSRIGSVLDVLETTTKLKGTSMASRRTGTKQVTKKGTIDKMDRNRPTGISKAVIGPVLSPICVRKTSLTRNAENPTHLQLFEDESSADGDKSTKKMTTISSTKSKDRSTNKITMSDRRSYQDHNGVSEENQGSLGNPIDTMLEKKRKGRTRRKLQ